MAYILLKLERVVRMIHEAQIIKNNENIECIRHKARSDKDGAFGQSITIKPFF